MGDSGQPPANLPSTTDSVAGLPDIREELARDGLSAAEVIELVCLDQIQRWRNGQRIPAEAYLALHPMLRPEAEGPSSWLTPS